MEAKERLNLAYEHLRKKGIVHIQQDVADIMGVRKENISRAFNGNAKYLTRGFLERFNKAFGDIFDINWLITGDGDNMLKSSQQSVPETNFLMKRAICMG